PHPRTCLAMPQLRYVLANNEMIVPAVVGLGQADATALLRAGQPIPTPSHARALIDTGSSVTAIAPAVLARLGLVRLVAATSQTASGAVAVNLYRVSLSIYDARGGPMFTQRDLLVSELTTALPSLDALIGMDVLMDCKLLVDGPGRQFTLEF